MIAIDWENLGRRLPARNREAQLARLIEEFPGIRELRFRENASFPDTKAHRTYLLSAALQRRGNLHQGDNQCRRCARGAGRYSECVSLRNPVHGFETDFVKGCCANCYTVGTNYCTFSMYYPFFHCANLAAVLRHNIYNIATSLILICGIGNPNAPSAPATPRRPRAARRPPSGGRASAAGGVAMSRGPSNQSTSTQRSDVTLSSLEAVYGWRPPPGDYDSASGLTRRLNQLDAIRHTLENRAACIRAGEDVAPWNLGESDGEEGGDGDEMEEE